jgi:hypothetical protein
MPVPAFINKMCPGSPQNKDIKDAELFFPKSTSTAKLPPAVVEDTKHGSDSNSNPTFHAGPQPQKSTQPISLPLIPIDIKGNNDNKAPTMSKVTSPSNLPLDPQMPIFQTQADKEAFAATLPSKMPLQLDQPFGEDSLTQSFYLQKTGTQALFFVDESGFIAKAAQRQMESSFLSARELCTLLTQETQAC